MVLRSYPSTFWVGVSDPFLPVIAFIWEWAIWGFPISMVQLMWWSQRRLCLLGTRLCLWEITSPQPLGTRYSGRSIWMCYPYCTLLYHKLEKKGKEELEGCDKEGHKHNKEDMKRANWYSGFLIYAGMIITWSGGDGILWILLYESGMFALGSVLSTAWDANHVPGQTKL